MSEGTINELRYYLNQAQLCMRTVNDTEKSDAIQAAIEMGDKLREQLPDHGTLIIDSKGITVIPFEVGDCYHNCFLMSNGRYGTGTGCVDTIVIDRKNGVIINDEIFLRALPTREEAEAECKRSNGDER